MSGHVRITCASADREAARRLADVLRETGIDIGLEIEGNTARGGESPEVEALIFLVSGESIASPGCLSELDRAAERDERVVPLVLEQVDLDRWPAALADRAWVLIGADGRDGPWIRKLVEALALDPRARDRHERLAARTAEWVSVKRDRSSLLRGADLLEAEAWLGDQAAHGQAPTDDEARFIADSRRAAVVRQRTRFAAVIATLVVTVTLAVIALGQRQDAAQVEREATSHGLAAHALSVVDRDPALAAALSVEAQRVDATPQAADAARAVLGSLGPAIGTLTGHTDRVMGVAFGGRRDVLASAGLDGTIRLWDIATRQQVGTPLRGHRGTVSGVAVSRDGGLVASGGADGTVRLWSVARHRELGAPLRGHVGPVRDVAFSRDARRLASAGDDGTVRIWDVARRRAAVAPLRGHAGGVVAR